jgi:hypothetical protein
MLFGTLEGLQPQQIQAESSDVYDEQAFRLAVVETWHLNFAKWTRDLKDEPKSGRSKKTDLVDPIAELLSEQRFTSYKAICWRSKIPRLACLPMLYEELGLAKFDLRSLIHTLDANPMAERVTRI